VEQASQQEEEEEVKLRNYGNDEITKASKQATSKT